MVPPVPPDMVSVVEEPAHIVLWLALTVIGGGKLSMTTITKNN